MPAVVKFIIGRAGSGKTHHLYSELGKALASNERPVLIVPEQFTFEAEAALCSQLGGLLGVKVLSFNRLSERASAMEEKPFISTQGRRMIVRRETQKLKKGLKTFAPVVSRPGFAAHIDTLLCQFRRYLITPQMLYDASAALSANAELSSKLGDIAAIYEATEAYLNENYIDIEGAHNTLLQKLKGTFLKGASIYIDGFDTLTSQLFAILTSMMQICSSLTMTFCIDPDGASRDATLFEPERSAYNRLMETASSLGCAVKTRSLPVFLHESKHSALYWLEQELYTVQPKVYNASTKDAVVVHGAVDRVCEVEALADKLIALARRGIRYRDMAVIASDMAVYAPLVQRAFALRNIPLFLDSRQKLRAHPAAQLLLCAAKAAKTGLSRTLLLRIAKTGLAGVTSAQTEEFENYCLKRGFLGGNSFKTEFPAEETVAEKARKALVEPLLELNKGFSKPSAGEKTLALYEYLKHLNLELSLKNIVEDLEREGRYALMDEHQQVYGMLIELFEQLHAIFENEPMSKQEYIDVLKEALSAYKIGMIPATNDQVLLGDFLRTRSRKVDALLLLGCNEGYLPKPRQDDEILDDLELHALTDLKFTLWEDTTESTKKDRLALYRALSSAKKFLWLGYSYSDGERELVPSTLIERVLMLFPGCEREGAAATGVANSSAKLSFDDLQTQESGFILLCRNLDRLEEPLFSLLYKYYLESPIYKARLIQAMTFGKTPVAADSIGEQLSKKLYGMRLNASISRLETFRSCPFKHFIRYGLRAEQRAEYKDRPEHIGGFYHLVLEAFVKKVKGLDLVWACLTREETDALLDEIIPKCLKTYENGLLSSNSRVKALSEAFWIKAVKETAWAICISFASGDFLPFGSEVKFGTGQKLKPISLKLDNATVLLSGKIDRIDEAHTPDGTRLVRVVDYKKNKNMELDYTKVHDGTSLQLPIYLAAAASAPRSAIISGKRSTTNSYKTLKSTALRKKPQITQACKAEAGSKNPTIAAGMFYQSVIDPACDDGKKNEDDLRLKGPLLEEEAVINAFETQFSDKSKTVKSLKKNGDGSLHAYSPVLNSKQMDALLKFAAAKAGEVTKALLLGNSKPEPVQYKNSTECEFCEYSSICRFDARLPGCRRRELKKLPREGFFQILESESKP